MCDLDQFREELRFLMPQVDYPVLSLGILERLGGSNEPLVALPAIRAKYGSHTVCATMGEQGALAWDGERFFYAPAYKVPVVDTTGAGDLFHAGFGYGLLSRWDLQHILEFGCAAAGLNCKAHGARGGINPVRTIERLRASRKCYPAQYSSAALEKAAERAHKSRA
jgi:sulfofructose kinase